MIVLAIKMLIGNRTTCLGIIFGIFLATLLISQQSAIFLGLLSRSYRMITDIPAPNLWVMDRVTESEEKVRLVPSSYLDVIRSISGVKWAVPICVANLPLTTESGIFDISRLYGIDDATLIGAPTHMIQGNIQDLRREGAVIVDNYSANSVLAKTTQGGKTIPLQISDELEINSHRAVVVGLCKITPGFYPQSILFTSYREFLRFTSFSIDGLSFIAVKTAPGASIETIKKEIEKHRGLLPLTTEEFKMRTVESFLKTGILINFGLSVALGIIIGFSISGQMFYSMTMENLMYYALIKAIGGTKWIVLRMILCQALLVGLIGFSLGMGATILWGTAIEGTTLAFLLPWELLLGTALIIFLICISTAAISIHRVLKTDPKVLMGN